MLWRDEALNGCIVQGMDGKIGTVTGFYFDTKWYIRYLAVETSTCRSNRRMLIAPLAIKGIDAITRMLWMRLTCEQIEKSPPIDLDQPVSRQAEITYRQYYGWPNYWSKATTTPLSSASILNDTAHLSEELVQKASLASYLQNDRDLWGDHLQARDGSIGHIGGFIIEDSGWTVNYLIVDIPHWWPGKKVLLPVQYLVAEWGEARKLYIDLPREVIKHAPGYDPAMPLDTAVTSTVLRHYAQQAK